MNTDRLLVTDVVAQTAATYVEFDAPALRVIIDYGVVDGPSSPLYWVLGGESPSYSFGIDIDGMSRRIQLVELRLYGDGIYPWPASALALTARQGIPIIDTGSWKHDSSIRDDDELFELQADGERLRVALCESKPSTRFEMGTHLALDLNQEKQVCAAIFQGIDPSVLDWFRDRYGLIS